MFTLLSPIKRNQKQQVTKEEPAHPSPPNESYLIKNDYYKVGDILKRKSDYAHDLDLPLYIKIANFKTGRDYSTRELTPKGVYVSIYTSENNGENFEWISKRDAWVMNDFFKYTKSDHTADEEPEILEAVKKEWRERVPLKKDAVAKMRIDIAEGPKKSLERTAMTKREEAKKHRADAEVVDKEAEEAEAELARMEATVRAGGKKRTKRRRPTKRRKSKKRRTKRR